MSIKHTSQCKEAHTRPITDQSVNEWLAAYGGTQLTAKEAGDSARDRLNNLHQQRELVYQGHRTTRRSALALSFIDMNTGEEATAFFNISLTGRNGKNYRPGDHGQFNSAKNGKFRKFWAQVVGRKPRRWSRVHQELHNELSRFIFTGKIETALDSEHQQYLKIKNLRPLKSHEARTEPSQSSHENRTGLAQTASTALSPEAAPSGDYSSAKLHIIDSAQLHRNTSTQTHKDMDSSIDTNSYGWLIRLPSGKEISRYQCAPCASYREILDEYPDATTIKPC